MFLRHTAIAIWVLIFKSYSNFCYCFTFSSFLVFAESA